MSRMPLLVRVTAALTAILLAGCTTTASPSAGTGSDTVARSCAPPPLAGTRISVHLVGMGMPPGMMGGSDTGRAGTMMNATTR